MEKSNIRGVIFVILSAFFFGVEYLLFDAVFQLVDITTQSAMFWSLLMTSVFVSPLFLAYQAPRKQLMSTFKKDGKIILLISVLSLVGIFLVFWSISASNSGITSLLFEQSNLLFVILLGVFLLGEKLSGKQVIGIFLTLAGVVFISNLKGEVSLPVVAGITSGGLVYALQSFIVKRYAPNLDGLPFVFSRTVIITGLWGIAMALLGQDFTPPPWNILFLLFLAGVSGTFVSQVLYFEAHNLLPISTLNIYSLVQPVFVLAGSILLLNAPLSLLKGVGAALILGGLLLITHGYMNEKKRKRQISK